MYCNSFEAQVQGNEPKRKLPGSNTLPKRKSKTLRTVKLIVIEQTIITTRASIFSLQYPNYSSSEYVC